MEFIDDVVIPLAQYLYLRYISLFRHWCWAASYIFATMCYTVTPQPIVPWKRFISHQRSHWSESYSIIFCMENKQIEKNHATNELHWNQSAENDKHERDEAADVTHGACCLLHTSRVFEVHIEWILLACCKHELFKQIEC